MKLNQTSGAGNRLRETEKGCRSPAFHSVLDQTEQHVTLLRHFKQHCDHTQTKQRLSQYEMKSDAVALLCF